MRSCCRIRAPHSLVLGLLFVSLLTVAAPVSPVQAQAVGFQPVVSSFPNGTILPVTPVVTSDRRYVRLSLAPQFYGLEGFDTFSVPAAVTGGGGLGAGGLGGGGLGGLGGGGGGGGNRVAAGMNGVEPAPAPGFGPTLGPAGPGFASPDAVAVLSGLGGPVPPPRLSDAIPDDPPPRRAATTRRPRVVRKGTRPTRK